MGVDWIFRLVDFFDAMVLESLNAGNRNFDEDLGEADNSPWFEQPTRLICAVLALRSLYHSLSKHNPKHQMQIASGTSVVLPSACYWIARNGPADLVSAGLSLIKRVVDENIDAGSKLSNMIIKVPPAQSGKNIPSGIVVPTLQFGWKPLPTDDRKFISLMALLAERYVYPCECWSPSSGDAPSIKDEEFEISATIDNYANACAEVFETILSVDQTTSDLLIQYILAPAPPPAIEPGEFADPSSVGQLDTMKPLGSILLNLLVEGCDRISSSQYPVIGMPSNVGKRSESDTIERASNLLSLLFVHGSQLAKELATAIHTGHTSGNISGANKQLLPLLLSSAGRAARMPSGSGSNILIALLRLLSTAASGCERAAKQVIEILLLLILFVINLHSLQLLDDPANLFVVDLATVSSESAGISPIVQVASSFFLGCCLQALPEPVEGDSTAAADSDGSISRRSFLAMIDGKIGLSRFSELLKRPLIPYRQNFGGINYNTFFISKGYRKFYEAQVEIIRGGIYEFYAGSAAAGGVDSVHQQIIALQNEKITELESKLESLQYNTNDDHNSLVNEPAGVSRASASVTEQLQKMLGEKDNELESYKKKEEDLTKSHEAELNVFKQQLEVADRLIPQYKETIENLQKEKDELHSNLSEKINTLNQSLLAAQAEANNLKHELSTAEERFNSDMMSENKDISINFEDQIVGLKKIILDVEEEKKNMKDSLDQKDRKIQLLTSELSSFNGDQSESITNLEKQVVELENRNAELVKQLWATQSELVSVKDASDDYNVAVNRDTEDSNGIVLTLWDSVATLISNLGIDVDDMEEIKERILNTDNGLKDRCSLIDYFVNQIIDSIQSAVGECSDIAEGAGIIQLDGYEGTIARVVDCCAKLSGKLMESSLKAEESDRFRSQLDDAENEIEVLQADKDALEEELLEFKTLLENAEKGKEAIKTQLYTIEDEYNTLEKQYQALLLKQDTNGSIHDSLEVSDDAINSSEIRIELDHTTVLYHQATESLARKEKEILDLCEKFSREGEVSEAKYLNLVKEKKELDSKYDDLVESFQNSELQRNQLENKIHSLEMEVNYLQDQQAETVDHATHQELNNTFTALSAEFDKQRIVIAEKDEELQRLSEKYSLLEQKLIASAATLTSALQERDQIKSELEQKRLLIEELESSSHAAKSGASYTDLDNEIKDLRRHLAIQESQIEVYTLTISEKDAEIDALRLKLSSSDDGDINASLALKNDLCVRMEHEIGSLKEHLDARERNLLDVNSRLSNCMNDLDIKLGEILELKEQNTQLLNDLTQSINERDQLKKTIENTEEMKLSHYDELTSENMSLTHEINSLNEQLEESRAALALATQKNTEVTLKSTEEKLSIATSETIAAQEMIEKLTTELATLQTELISLREKEVQDTAKMNSLADQLVDTLAAKKKLELQMIDSDKELNKKIVQLNSYQMDSESWGKTIEQLKQEVDSLKETVEKVTVDNESLRSQTSNYRASIKDLTKQNEQLKQQSDDLRKISLFTNDMEAFRAQDIELRRLTDTVERLAKQVNSKEQELSKLMSTLKRKEGETAGLFSTLEGLNAEMEQIRVENEALAQSAAGLERQIKEIKRENVLLKSSSQLHKNELQTYKLQLSATKTKQSDENKYDAYHRYLTYLFIFKL